MPVNIRQRLSYRQAKITVVVAFLLGLALSSFQIMFDLLNEREEVDHTVHEIFRILRESAVNSVYYIDEREAETVVKGLFQYNLIREVHIVDDLGTVLAQEERPVQQTSLKWLVSLIFQQENSYRFDLSHPELKRELGYVSVTIDDYLIARKFIQRAGLLIVSDLVKNIILSGILLFFFYHTLTQPLMVIARQVSQVDPSNPKDQPVDIPKGHNDNEMGSLVRSLNHLLSGFDESLTRRRIAESELTRHRDHLEQLVREKTSELKASLRKVEEANRNVMDSLQYAKVIQSSLLPDINQVKNFLPNSFVIWKPRDVVGGDLFFMESFQDGFIVAVLDCTGHGVPGAFMTMLASSGLQRIIRDEGLRDPAKIIKKLNANVKILLQQDKDHAGSDDGMDAAVCYINTERKRLTYSGARIPLNYVYKNEVKVIKADRHSIGYKKSDLGFDFVNHHIDIEKGMSFYLNSDGLVEQLGGEKNICFGNKRFRKLLLDNSHKSFDLQQQALMDSFYQYRGDNEIQDDITVVGFSFS